MFKKNDSQNLYKHINFHNMNNNTNTNQFFHLYSFDSSNDSINSFISSDDLDQFDQNNKSDELNQLDDMDQFNNEEEITSNNIYEKKYVEPVILENIHLDKFFSKEDIQISHINQKKLLITDKGLYSISKPHDAQWITDIILQFIKGHQSLIGKNVSIIDGTAGIGGNTINFSKYFYKVYAIEINDTHFKVLKNNMEALHLMNVKFFQDNFLNIVDKIQDKGNDNIFFFDPPWGGKSYKNFKYFNLKIGKNPIAAVINILYEKNIKYVVLKAPFNLNISMLYTNIKYQNINIHKNSKKNMILIIMY
jgi:16S rRNA G966 N2-methylase RsmD